MAGLTGTRATDGARVGGAPVVDGAWGVDGAPVVDGARGVDVTDVVSRFTGLVQYVRPMSFTPDSIPDTLYSARTADAGFLTGTATDPFSMGPGDTPEAARRACIGEAVERFALADARPSARQAVGRIRRGTALRQVPPSVFSRFADSQYRQPGFRFERVRDGDVIDWVEGIDVHSGEPVLLPAQMVLFADPHPVGLDGERMCEPHYETATSSGVAAGPTFPFAAKRAILELAERDAFQRTWLLNDHPPRLEWDPPPTQTSSAALSRTAVEQLRRLERTCSRFGAVFSLRVLPSPLGIPVLLAVLRSGITGVALGCAADIDADRAALNAVREAIHTHNWCLRLLADPPIAPEAITEFAHHVAFHARPSARHYSAALDDSARRVVSLPRVHWPTVVGTAASRGIRLYLVDLTSDEVAAAGFSVVRALSPDLVPLDVLHDARFLGSPSLRDARHPHPESLNPLPHPFP
ncbi:YcaO-like family protein [Planctomonas psychrotolerans]|uniref:YcaO-like family protein n=1 Tax=Planctomonas psychrotolerans TaxID=2528712 RepID=UPI00123B08A1|nr:YcaO-like family protein [Planctomonas psychrotolerans]